MTTSFQAPFLLLLFYSKVILSEVQTVTNNQQNNTAASISSSPSQISKLSPSSVRTFRSESPPSSNSVIFSSPRDFLHSIAPSSFPASSSSSFPRSPSFPTSSYSPLPSSSSFSPSSSPSPFSFSPSTFPSTSSLSSSSDSTHFVPVHPSSINAVYSQCDLHPKKSSNGSSTVTSFLNHSHTQTPSAADSDAPGLPPSPVHLHGNFPPYESSQLSSFSPRGSSQLSPYSPHQNIRPLSSSVQESNQTPSATPSKINQLSTSPAPGSTGKSTLSSQQSIAKVGTYGGDEAFSTGNIKFQESNGTFSPSTIGNGTGSKSRDQDLGMTRFMNETQQARRVSWCGVVDDDDDDDDDVVGDKSEWKDEKNVTKKKVDRRKRYTLYDQHWEKKELTWTLRTRSRNPEVTENMVLRTMTDAFKIWSDASSLTFRRVRMDDPEVDIYVDFHRGSHGDSWPFDRRGGTLAHAFYPTHGDIHFDDDENFVEHSRYKEPGVTSLFYTAVHELGHSLGLRHSNTEGALMAPYYQEIPPGFTLPDDDRYAIQAIYGPPTGKNSSIATITYPPEPPTRSPTRPPRPTSPPPRPTTPSRRPPPTTRPYQPKPPHPRPTIPPQGENTCKRVSPPEDDKPDICSSTIDAVTTYRQDIWFFKGRYYWRVKSRNDFKLDRNYPRLIRSLFRALPPSVGHIDAAIETLDRRSIVFFSGNNFYWLGGRSGLELIKDGTLQSLGFGPEVRKLDAAFTWGHNGRTYFISGDQYWRFDTDKKSIVEDYPRYIGVWDGLPPNVSAAFTFRAATYFFEGNVFWRFNNLLMAVELPPSVTATFWFSCPHIDQDEVYDCTS